ncbi:YjjG family noncanonical pyrimidine nucleotidase [Paenibacillus sp. URB8-2]|uniref:YjjG family noncanonical pyrimidine nucleotidase n=1 Tax=Paenibacillus sp. URB8-2 TaxID=2741301 RepID=UPI0015B9B25B|nr:YjjG family noncanonical pyrimidine nucleotidase [Paenibacillus sp. URB8-2]BCG57566.1 noncanonical pyrimidine nucleotidase, YjjG family protein [Paenibacillus sp. URB8-2]
MKYEVILFDADDTLFDYGQAESYALREAFNQFGMPSGFDICAPAYKEINKALWRDLELGLISSAVLRVERFTRLFAAHGLDLDPESFSASYLNHLGEGIFLVEGAAELCDELAGCRLAVITNGIKEVQYSRIQGSPLRDTFAHIIISEEVGSQKPERGIFDHAFARLGLTAEDKHKVLIVGDTLTSDIQGGISYGIDTCWFNPSGKPRDPEIIPTYEIRSLSELRPIAEGKPGGWLPGGEGCPGREEPIS